MRKIEGPSETRIHEGLYHTQKRFTMELWHLLYPTLWRKLAKKFSVRYVIKNEAVYRRDL